MAVALAILGPIKNGGSFAAGAGSQEADTTKEMIVVYGTMTLSGNYGTSTSHGDPVDFTTLNPPWSFGNQAPTFVDIKELVAAGSAPAGYIYNYNPGPTLAAPTQKGGVLQILSTGTASGDGLNEITEGSAYSGFSPSLNGTVLWFEAKFARL
jgi:hypothetical protein